MRKAWQSPAGRGASETARHARGAGEDTSGDPARTYVLTAAAQRGIHTRFSLTAYLLFNLG